MSERLRKCNYLECSQYFHQVPTHKKADLCSYRAPEPGDKATLVVPNSDCQYRLLREENVPALESQLEQHAQSSPSCKDEPKVVPYHPHYWPEGPLVPLSEAKKIEKPK